MYNLKGEVIMTVQSGENKEDIILNAARELMCNMAQEGGEITVDMIAKHAGIAKGGIYYYFQSKDEIIDEVIKKSYTAAIKEFFTQIDEGVNTLEKLKRLFYSMLRAEFTDSRKNVLSALNVREDIVLRYKMMSTAVAVVSPILCRLLEEGVKDGSIHTDTPKESAEMIVATLTFLLNDLFPSSDGESRLRKMKIYARVLETCLKTEPGSFDFLFEQIE